MARLDKQSRYLSAKLAEECAELAAAATKLLARPTRKRIERMKSEAADVIGLLRVLKYLDDPYIHGASLDRTRRERARMPR